MDTSKGRGNMELLKIIFVNKRISSNKYVNTIILLFVRSTKFKKIKFFNFIKKLMLNESTNFFIFFLFFNSKL